MGLAPGLAAQPSLQRLDHLRLHPVKRRDLACRRFNCSEVSWGQVAAGFERDGRGFVDIAERSSSGRAGRNCCGERLLRRDPAFALRRSGTCREPLGFRGGRTERVISAIGLSHQLREASR